LKQQKKRLVICPPKNGQFAQPFFLCFERLRKQAEIDFRLGCYACEAFGRVFEVWNG
jgi:hypothetical protein